MNEIKIFNNPEFGQIRTTTDEQGEPLFCLKDVCDVLGLQARDVAQRLRRNNLPNEGEVVSNNIITDSLGREQSALFVTEDGLYDAIFDSRKPFARQFRKWVTAEVLPAIRKQGGYMTVKDETPEETIARALLMAQHTIELRDKRIALQAEQLKLQAPKVAYVDEVLASDRTYTTTQIAKELDMTSAQALQKMLCDNGIMFRQSGQWLLTAKYSAKGYTKTRTHTYICSSGEQGTNTITVWTETGRAFLHTIIKKITELKTK